MPSSAVLNVHHCTLIYLDERYRIFCYHIIIQRRKIYLDNCDVVSCQSAISANDDEYMHLYTADFQN